MRINDIFESKKIDNDDLNDMDLSDALFVLSEMVDDEKMSEQELSIIEDMFERLFEEENDAIATINEANITDHADTKKDRSGAFKKSKMSDRIKKRIYSRRYRKRSDVKMKAKKRAAVQKRCKGKNRSAQLSRPGSTTYVCKLKNRFRSKLMKRVAKRYGN